eukprot:471218-Prymnesium_polylepis.1
MLTTRTRSVILTRWLSTEPVLDSLVTLRNVVAATSSPTAMMLYACQRSSISSGSSETSP